MLQLLHRTCSNSHGPTESCSCRFWVWLLSRDNLTSNLKLSLYPFGRTIDPNHGNKNRIRFAFDGKKVKIVSAKWKDQMTYKQPSERARTHTNTSPLDEWIQKLNLNPTICVLATIQPLQLCISHQEIWNCGNGVFLFNKKEWRKNNHENNYIRTT